MTIQPAHPDVESDGEPAADQPWQRLALGMLLVEPVREIIKFIPMLIVLVLAGNAGESGPPWGLIGTAAVIALGISRWVTTRYRITPTVVEVRRGVFQRKHLTVPRDRVRTVDVSAHPLQRLLRLVKVEIGTGTSHHRSETLKLDGLPVASAAPLRAELLHRVPPAASASGFAPGSGPMRPGPDGQTSGTTAEIDDESETLLARLDPRWIGYAPATLSGVVTGAVLIGLGWRIVNEARLDPTKFRVVDQTLEYLHGTPIWLDVLQVTGVVIVVVTVLSIVGYVLSFWGFRLSRHSRGTLQVSRGLLTTRATSIEERRLHGVDRSEPLLLRLVGGARLQAVATGLRHRGSEKGSALLLPPAPLPTVVAVEADVLGSAEPGHAQLIQHGPAARRRRYSRAIGVGLVVVVTLFALTGFAEWLLVPAAVSLLALPLAALLARDRYRNLGHAVVGDRLITQAGSLVRRRIVLAVPGVIGVTLRQSFFQRRSGLISLTATTAAGAQHYLVPDVPDQPAIDLAVRLVPECRSFLVSAHTRVAPAEQSGPAVLRDGAGVSRLPG